MRGLLIVSERDRLLHASADEELWELWRSRVADVSSSNHAPSTSSGVSTDHDDELDEKEFPQASKRLSLNDIGLVVLPMVALYRSSSVVNHDEYEKFYSATGRVVFSRLAGGFLLIAICERFAAAFEWEILQ